jgi:hypothetical protein
VKKATYKGWGHLFSSRGPEILCENFSVQNGQVAADSQWLLELQDFFFFLGNRESGLCTEFICSRITDVAQPHSVLSYLTSTYMEGHMLRWIPQKQT